MQQLVRTNKRFRIVEVPAAQRPKRKVLEYYDANKEDAAGNKKDMSSHLIPGEKYRPDWQKRERELPQEQRLFDVTNRGGASVRLTEEAVKRLRLDEDPEMVDIDTGELIPLVSVASEALSRPVRKGAV